MGADVKLHLGVLEVPYDDGKATTGEVADILEEKYHIMEVFVEELGDAIGDAFAEAAKNALQDLMSGVPMVQASYIGGGANFVLTADATQEIETAFRMFIDQQELDGVVPGVPTQASLKGINHRLAHPYAKANQPRPSFRDTGLYQSSFRAWTET
jgi:hypothetical protein